MVRSNSSMSLACVRYMSLDTPILLAAVLSGRRRPKRLPWAISGCGLPTASQPEAAELPGGWDERVMDELLACDDFRALVAAAEEPLA